MVHVPGFDDFKRVAQDVENIKKHYRQYALDLIRHELESRGILDDTALTRVNDKIFTGDKRLENMLQAVRAHVNGIAFKVDANESKSNELQKRLEAVVLKIDGLDHRLDVIETKALNAFNKFQILQRKVEAHFESHADNEIAESLSGLDSIGGIEVKESSFPFLINRPGARSGHPWSKDEERWLEREFKSVLSEKIHSNIHEGAKDLSRTVNIVLNELADKNGRTAHALECRLAQLGYDLDFI